jgi:hypothetical protein
MHDRSRRSEAGPGDDAGSETPWADRAGAGLLTKPGPNAAVAELVASDHRRLRPSHYGASATASISTVIRGSIRPETSSIVINGRIEPKTSPWARPTSPAREMSVT